MNKLSSTKANALYYRTGLVVGLLATVMVVSVVALGVRHLGSDLWALFGEQEAVASEVAVSQTLPVDAPAVSLLRYKDQESESSRAASNGQEGVLLLNDWTFTQGVCPSPFFFTSPSPMGFDFFNPLFAFNFCPKTTQPVVQSVPAVSPFGFSCNTCMGAAPVMFPTCSGVPILAGGTGGITVTTTNSTPFLNGASIFVTVTTTRGVFPIALGSGGGFSNRHVFTPVIMVVTITIVPISPSK